MPRDDSGFLKPDALRSGVPDQWAATIMGTTHAVSIVHDIGQGGYVCQHVITRSVDEVREVHAWQVGERLDLAQIQFKKIVRSLGGKA